MQVRLVAFLLLSGCYFPGGQSFDRESVELAPHAVLRSGDRSLVARACSGHASCYDVRTDLSDLHERNVGIEVGMPEQPSLEVSLPVAVLDCSTVGLTVVGQWQAELGDSIVLSVMVRGLDGVEQPPSLSWTTTAGELTELGPSSAQIQCSVPGGQTVSVEIAPPAPCPSQLELAIDCVAPAIE